MKAAVRFYSRSGNTKLVADAIAEALGISAVSVDAPEAELKEKADVLFVGGALYAYGAVSVDAPEAELKEKADVLFVGGALYAYGLDRHLKEYLEKLSAGQVGKAVIFSTSWISKHSIDLIRKALEAKGIPVEKETFYVKNKADEKQLKEAAAFAKKMAG